MIRTRRLVVVALVGLAVPGGNAAIGINDDVAPDFDLKWAPTDPKPAPAAQK